MATRAFGVGCIAFEWRESGSEDSEWGAAVTTALNGLANVRDVSVRTSGVFRSASEVLYENTRGNTRNAFRPEPVHARIDFVIHVPRRIQDELTHRLVASTAETFRVVVEYDLYGPVAFFTALDGGPDDGASGGVAAVRKFLEKNLTGRIEVTTVGPSPFHSDFFLRPGKEMDAPFALEIRRREGYYIHNFTYNTDEFESVDEALKELFDLIRREGVLFYSTIRRRNRRRERAGAVAQRTEELIAAQGTTGLRARVSRVFKGGGQARDLMLRVIRAEFDASQDRAWAEGLMSSHYAANTLPCMKEEIEANVSADDRDQLESARLVADLVERGRGKEFEVVVIAAATLLGGLAGAIAALVAR